MVVSELCSNGDLFDYIRNVQAPPLLEVVCTLGPSHNLCLTISKVGVMLDVAHGLEYLHSCGMVYWEIFQWHRQVKQFPWGVSFSCVCLLLAAHMIQEMNEHAIYETGSS
jgi:hypothetical protein